MHAGAQTAEGHFTNTEDTDCEQCKADLYLFSIVSHAQPGRACCPEHAGLLEQPLTLLYRYWLPLRCLWWTAAAVVAAPLFAARCLGMLGWSLLASG